LLASFSEARFHNRPLIRIALGLSFTPAFYDAARLPTKGGDERRSLMVPVLDAVKAYCTLGEVSDVFRKVCGAYREKGSF